MTEEKKYSGFVVSASKDTLIGIAIGIALTVLAFTAVFSFSKKTLWTSYALDQHLLKQADKCKAGFLCETHFSSGASMICTPESTMQRLVETLKGKNK